MNFIQLYLMNITICLSFTPAKPKQKKDTKMEKLECIEYEIINGYGEWQTVTVYEWIETETEKTEKETK